MYEQRHYLLQLEKNSDTDSYIHRQQNYVTYLIKQRPMMETQCSLQGPQMALGLWYKKVKKVKGGSINISLRIIGSLGRR